MQSCPQEVLTPYKDWSMTTDVGKQLCFPTNIAVTTRRSDIILWLTIKKRVLSVELTLPREQVIQKNI